MGKVPDGGAKLLTDLLHNPKNFVTAEYRNRKGGPVNSGIPDENLYPDKTPTPGRPPRAPDRMTPGNDVEQDRRRLRQALHDKIDEVKDERDPSKHWTGGRRRPCMSAVWDRETGKISYNHNSMKKPVDPKRLHPILRERHKEYLKTKEREEKEKKGENVDDVEKGTWKKYEDDQDKHGAPGQHSESRATNAALKEATADYMKGDRPNPPRLEDFMVENAAPNDKKAMPCCPQCTQMIDGVDGSSRGWDKDANGNKLNRTDGWGYGDESRVH